MAILSLLSFKEDQLKYARVKKAYEEKEAVVNTYFSVKGIEQRNFNLFIRAFKKERKLEVWVKAAGKAEYTLLTEYDFCTSSGMLGPKRKEGDLQIPEGVYYINHFNPQSNFYLSLGLNYPNASDRILGDKQKPGGDIYIHGSCVTIGCIPITDEKIKELYILAVEARNNGQQRIPVHIFPSRLTEENVASLGKAFGNTPELIRFWQDLRLIYNDFEKSRIMKTIHVDASGRYRISGPGN